MKNKRGRPSFQLHPARLKDLRERAQLTQLKLSKLLFEKTDPHRDEESMKRSYARIEQTGKTSRETATRLTEVLGRLLDRDPKQLFTELCGGQREAPPDHVEEIENRLKEQIRSGGNPALQLALRQSCPSDQPDEDDIKALARDIAFLLETAQLEQRHEELSRLTELTGWSVDKLLRPTSLHGYWLLITNTLVHRKPATRDTEILMGVSEVMHHIQVRGTEWLAGHKGSDTQVELREDAPWFRVTLSALDWPFRQEFSFVRCHPDATGLQWVKPSEWDRWLLRGDDGQASALTGWAFEHANLVKGFEADDMWPSDVGRLRLAVQQKVKPANPESVEYNDRWRTVTIHKGWLGEEPVFQNEQRESFRAAGQEHTVVTKWLESRLWEDVLTPLLSPIPAAWWHMEPRGGNITISTKLVAPSHAARHGLEDPGRTYTIRLVEELESGELRTVPWRQQDLKALAERLQKDLETSQRQVSIGPQRPSWLTTD